MRTNYALLVRALPPDSLEEFVDDWLEQRVKDYHSHELWRGTGDMAATSLAMLLINVWRALGITSNANSSAAL